MLTCLKVQWVHCMTWVKTEVSMVILDWNTHCFQCAILWLPVTGPERELLCIPCWRKVSLLLSFFCGVVTPHKLAQSCFHPKRSAMLADQKEMLFYIFKGFYFHLLFRYVCHALSCIPLKGLYIQLDSKGNVFLSMPEILSVSINNKILPS